MTTTKLKNRINKKTGHFICNGRCGQDVRMGHIIGGRVFCNQDGEIKLGIRDERGLLKK